jgi:2'-5' RNA ligase
VDVTDAPASDSVMIALLPTDSSWCNIDLPHLTLVYAGLIADLSPTDFSDLAKDAAMLAMLSWPFGLFVQAQQLFGPNQDTNVFTLKPTPELWAMRRAVEKWNASQFPFTPHVTIGPAGSVPAVVPQIIRFNQLMLAWGDEQLTFNMTTTSNGYAY